MGCDVGVEFDMRLYVAATISCGVLLKIFCTFFDLVLGLVTVWVTVGVGVVASVVAGVMV